MPTRRAFLAGISATSLAATIRHAGGAGNGRADDSAAIQAAIDKAAQSGGGEVHVPAGVYLVRGLRLRSNVRFVGEGRGRTVLRETSGSAYLLSINPGTEGSADPSLNEHDIEIAGISFEGPVAAMGFAEHQHLLNFNGVTRLHVHDCRIAGFRGDGIYLGSGNVAGTERHNRDVRIARNEFDGVNADNRNAVSVIDGDGIVISQNRFVRCSRANMPGPIDIEPDGHAFQRIANISIEENHFEDCGGNVAKIAFHVPIPAQFAGVIGNLRIARNVVGAAQRSGDALYVRVLDAGGGKARPVAASGIEVLENVLANGKARLQGIESFVIRGNEFKGRNCGLVVGAIRGEIALNTFHPATDGDAALVIGRARRVVISRNRFAAPEGSSRLPVAILLQAQGGKPLGEELALEDNLFADAYRVHVASKAPATAAHLKIGAGNRTSKGGTITTAGVRRE